MHVINQSDIDKAKELWTAFWVARSTRKSADIDYRNAIGNYELGLDVTSEAEREAFGTANEAYNSTLDALQQFYATINSDSSAILDEFLGAITELEGLRATHHRYRYYHLHEGRYGDLIPQVAVQIVETQQRLERAQIALDELTGTRVSE